MVGALETGAGAPVALLHGLWMPALVMLPLSRRLERAGFRAERFGYRTTADGLDQNAGRLLAWIEERGLAGAHLVGHSLGGLVILRMLERNPGLAFGRVVLLGTPCTGSATGRALSASSLGRRFARATGPAWSCAAEIPAGREVGMIAGTRGIGLGRILTRLSRPNDGAVALEETRVAGLADRLELPLSHSGLIVSGPVAAAVARFLRSGRFGAAVPPR